MLRMARPRVTVRNVRFGHPTRNRPREVGASAGEQKLKLSRALAVQCGNSW